MTRGAEWLDEIEMSSGNDRRAAAFEVLDGLRANTRAGVYEIPSAVGRRPTLFVKVEKVRKSHPSGEGYKVLTYLWLLVGMDEIAVKQPEMQIQILEKIAELGRKLD